MKPGLDVGYTQLGIDLDKNYAPSTSLDAKFDNGIRANLNWVDLDEAKHSHGGIGISVQQMGFGLGYVLDGWTVAFISGEFTEDIEVTDKVRRQNGYAIAVAASSVPISGEDRTAFGVVQTADKPP